MKSDPEKCVVVPNLDTLINVFFCTHASIRVLISGLVEPQHFLVMSGLNEHGTKLR